MNILEQAHKLINTKKFDQALTLYNNYINQDSDDKLEILGHRAWLLRQMGRYDDAIRDYQLLLENDPQNIAANYLLAETILFSGEPELAMDHIRKTATTHLDSTLTLRFLMQYHCYKNDGQNLVEAIDAKTHPVTQWPINPMITLLEKYDSSYPASCFPETSRFLYDFVRMIRPEYVIETGTYIGHSTICLAQALEHNHCGHLHSFDIFFDNPLYVSPIMGPCSDAYKVAQTHIDKAGLSHRVTLHKGNSSQMIKSMYPKFDGHVKSHFHRNTAMSICLNHTNY